MNSDSRWLGTVEYTMAIQLQDTLSERIRHSTSGILLGLEHEEVITLGVRGEKSDIVQISSTPVCRADRGGQATYHNPGQLIIYPICPIGNWKIGARNWVDSLAEVTQLSLSKCNIIVISKTNGIYTKKGKIASIGLNLKGGVSTHGIAINVSNDLSGFSKIRVCGSPEQAMDRVGDYFDITPEAFFSIWCEQYNAVFAAKSAIGGDSSLTSEGLQL